MSLCEPHCTTAEDPDTEFHLGFYGREKLESLSRRISGHSVLPGKTTESGFTRPHAPYLKALPLQYVLYPRDKEKGEQPGHQGHQRVLLHHGVGPSYISIN